jgi:acyl carrier protein
MDRTAIAEHVNRSLSEVLRRDITELTDDTRLFEDLHLDSTAILELLMALEDNVGIEVDPETLDMDDFRTVGTLVDYLARATTVAA